MKTLQDTFMSTAEASAILGYKTKVPIANLCRAGKIPGACLVGHSWLIPTDWVEERKKLDIATGSLDEHGNRKHLGPAITTGAGIRRKDRGGPGGTTGKPVGRPKKIDKDK